MEETMDEKKITPLTTDEILDRAYHVEPKNSKPAKTVFYILFRLVPLLLVLPLSGIGILEYQNLLLIYIAEGFCVYYAGKNRNEYLKFSKFIFFVLAGFLLLVRIFGTTGVLQSISIEGFYKNDSVRFYFILFSIMSLVMMTACQMILGFTLKYDRIGKICGLVVVAVFEAVILYFVIHAICNSNLYNHVMLLEEMFVQKVF